MDDIDLQIGAFIYYLEQCDKNGTNFDFDICARDVNLHKVSLGGDTPSIKNGWSFLIMCVSGRYEFESKKQTQLAYDATINIINKMNFDLDQYCECITYRQLIGYYKERILYYDLSSEIKKKVKHANNLRYFLKDIELPYMRIYLPEVVHYFSYELNDEEIDPYKNTIHTLLNIIINKYPDFENEYDSKNSLNLALKTIDDNDARIIEYNIEQLIKYMNKYDMENMIDQSHL